MVFAFGMSMPDSMMVVHSSTLKRCLWKSSITRSSFALGHLPVAMPMRAGTSAFELLPHAADAPDVVVQEVHRPPRLSSRWKAFAQLLVVPGRDEGLHCEPVRGGVAMMDRSRSPAMAMFSVRGIGVAVSVSRCTLARSAFSASFWRTPNRFLVDDDQPQVLEAHVLLQQAVGADDHVDLAFGQLAEFGLDSSVLKRDSTSTFSGQSAKRSRMVR